MAVTTYYLQAADEQTMWEALEGIGLAWKFYDPNDPANHPPEDPPVDWHPTGAYTWTSSCPMLDMIGTVFVATGQRDENGAMTFEPVDDLYYANLREDLTDEQAAALPTIPAPASPYRIWAGDN